jgi:hypothetical protein
LDALIAEVDQLDLDVESMRTPVPGEPVVFGPLADAWLFP